MQCTFAITTTRWCRRELLKHFSCTLSMTFWYSFWVLFWLSSKSTMSFQLSMLKGRKKYNRKVILSSKDKWKDKEAVRRIKRKGSLRRKIRSRNTKSTRIKRAKIREKPNPKNDLFIKYQLYDLYINRLWLKLILIKSSQVITMFVFNKTPLFKHAMSMVRFNFAA